MYTGCRRKMVTGILCTNVVRFLCQILPIMFLFVEYWTKNIEKKSNEYYYQCKVSVSPGNIN